MKLHAIYNVNGSTSRLHAKGPQIMVQTRKSSTVIQIFNNKGKRIKRYHLNEVYYVEVVD